MQGIISYRVLREFCSSWNWCINGMKFLYVRSFWTIVKKLTKTKTMNYFVYITTNPGKTVLYTGVTNDLYSRMYQHYQNRGQSKTFAGRYFCYNLVYYESFYTAEQAIEREKEIKGWTRKKKMALVRSKNSKMNFLNKSI